MSENSSRNQTLRYGLAIVFILVPLINFILPPLISDGDRFSNDPQTRVAAASYAFAIWGVIFTGMIWFSFALVYGKEPDTLPLRKAIVCLIVAGLASIAFVPISIYASFTMGWIDIVAHLIPLALAAVYLRKHVRKTEGLLVRSLTRWSYFGPSMYFGWICAATVISTSLAATEWGIELNENMSNLLTMATLVILGMFAGWMTFNKDPVYGVTVCWALIAVGVKQADYPAIQWTAWGVASAIGAITLFVVIKPGCFYPTTRSGAAS